MTNFSVNFSNPWLLLLLIPAVGFTLLPYFRVKKKYRRTRNRIVSIVLHMLIMVLCITVFAGIRFTYDIPNRENEVLLLVDDSYSGERQEVPPLNPPSALFPLSRNCTSSATTSVTYLLIPS
ncbi:MAG: hypothetical protein II368_03670, partial [Clostridia bacterium]|nr:hypothetical protein [Clostridia bacterium]